MAEGTFNDTRGTSHKKLADVHLDTYLKVMKIVHEDADLARIPRSILMQATAISLMHDAADPVVAELFIP